MIPAMNFPLFLIVASLASSVVSSLLPGRFARKLTLTLTAASLICNLILLAGMIPLGHSVTYLMGHFPHPWGNELKFGILEPLFSAIFSFVMMITLLGGKIPLLTRVKPEKENFYYMMMDLVQASLLALVYTNDIFTGYVFIEICTLSSCGILLIRENGRTILAATRYMIFSLIGSGLFLFGVIFLYEITGHLLMPELKETIAALWSSGAYRLPLLAAISLITIGIAIKSGLCPFHLWMVDTYGAAIPSSSGVLSGLISKGYIFFLIKVIYNVFGINVFYASGVHSMLYVLGCAGVIVGSVGALHENNIFRMTACSSAAQIGYVYMGIGLSGNLGMLAALFQILTHAVTKPAIFLAASHLSYASDENKKFRNLQGAGYRNVWAGISFSYEAFSMIGLPLTMGFIAKYLFAVAAFDSTAIKVIPTMLVLAASTILNTLYFTRTIIRIYNRPSADMNGKKVSIPMQKSYFAAGVLFLVLNLFFGVFAKSFIDLLTTGVQIF